MRPHTHAPAAPPRAFHTSGPVSKTYINKTALAGGLVRVDSTGIEPVPRVCQGRHATITPRALSNHASKVYNKKTLY